MSIWYDEETLLEQVLDDMPEDIQYLFDDQPYVTESDIDFVAEIEAADEEVEVEDVEYIEAGRWVERQVVRGV